MRRFLLFLVVSFAAAAGGPARAVEVRLPDQAEVSGDYIGLAEIAQFMGATTREATALEGVFLGPAPRVINRGYVVLRIESAGLALADVRVTGASSTVVTKRGGAAPAVELVPVGLARSSADGGAVSPVGGPAAPPRADQSAARSRVAVAAAAAVREHVVARTGWRLDDVVVEAASVALANDRLPALDAALKVTGVRTRAVKDERDYLGQVSFSFDLVAGETAMPGVVGTFRVQRWAETVTARRAIATGAVIRADDLSVERRLLTRGDGDTFESPSGLVGQQAAMAVAAGEPVSRRAVRLTPAVKNGESILVATGAARRRAQALRDGLLGDYIPARYEVAGRPAGAPVLVRVTGRGTATPDAVAGEDRKQTE
ncbi:MAG: flagella basal body P-ring formation protein FlgA [Planctomycetes bacterium]|nr:flagella basal body P-ring formation protein FlgA [Planctomycetota bacterium]